MRLGLPFLSGFTYGSGSSGSDSHFFRGILACRYEQASLMRWALAGDGLRAERSVVGAVALEERSKKESVQNAGLTQRSPLLNRMLVRPIQGCEVSGGENDVRTSPSSYKSHVHAGTIADLLSNIAQQREHHQQKRTKLVAQDSQANIRGSARENEKKEGGGRCQFSGVFSAVRARGAEKNSLGSTAHPALQTLNSSRRTRRKSRQSRGLQM